MKVIGAGTCPCITFKSCRADFLRPPKNRHSITLSCTINSPQWTGLPWRHPKSRLWRFLPHQNMDRHPPTHSLQIIRRQRIRDGKNQNHHRRLRRCSRHTSRSLRPRTHGALPRRKSHLHSPRPGRMGQIHGRNRLRLPAIPPSHPPLLAPRHVPLSQIPSLRPIRPLG